MREGHASAARQQVAAAEREQGMRIERAQVSALIALVHAVLAHLPDDEHVTDSEERR